MTAADDFERERTDWSPAWRALGITAVAFTAACFADSWVYRHVSHPGVYDRDWGRLLRVMGFLGTWVALAVAVALHEGTEPLRRALARRRAWLLFGSAALGGIVAEIGKLSLRRERPQLHDGLHGFRAFSENPWSTAGLALPSSHALVAFGGAAMLARLFPRARCVGYALAVGCAATRVMARAHFLSDVVLAAGLGWLVAFVLTRRWSPAEEVAP